MYPLQFVLFSFFIENMHQVCYGLGIEAYYVILCFEIYNDKALNNLSRYISILCSILICEKMYEVLNAKQREASCYLLIDMTSDYH